MSLSRKEEIRALDTDERELVDRTRHPAIQDVSDADLADLIKLVRERRDRAQSLASRRRREMRGKSEARGARASAADEGSHLKTEVLAMAMRRLNAERQRRERAAARSDLVSSAQNALALKRSAGGNASGKPSRSSRKGMAANESDRSRETIAPKRVGSVSKQNKVAQARRDAR